MVGSNGGTENEQDDAHSDGHFTDNGSEPEEGQTRSTERVFLSERAGRRVYRQMANTERSLGEKLDTLITLMQSLVQLQTGQAAPAPAPPALAPPAPTQPAPGQDAPAPPVPPAPAPPAPAPLRPPLPIQDARFQLAPVTTAHNQRRTSPNGERPPMPPMLAVSSTSSATTPNMVTPATASPTSALPPSAFNPAPANTMVYKLTRKVPTFSGKNVENVRIWLQQMDNLFTAALVPEEDPKNTHTSLMTPHLLEPAKGVYWSLYYKNECLHLPWSRFKEEMIKEYDNTDVRGEILRKKIMECGARYQGHTTLEDYMKDFCELELQLMDMSFHDKFFYFKQPLPETLKTHLSRADVYTQRSMNLVYQLAQEWVAPKIIASSNRDGHHHRHHPHKHHKHHEHHKVRNKNKAKQSSSITISPADNDEDALDVFDVFDVSTAKCYNCGTIGHISKDCKTRHKGKKVSYKGRKYFLLDPDTSDSSIYSDTESDTSDDAEDVN